MLIDQGMNDCWIRPQHLKRVGAGRYTLTLAEPLGKLWLSEIVAYELPAELRRKDVRVTRDGCEVPSQRAGHSLAILVENLLPGERREYQLEPGQPAISSGNCRFTRTGSFVIFSNGVLALKLPASGPGVSVGPIVAVRRQNGPWLGRGRLESPLTVRSVRTRVIEHGPLWTTAEVRYAFAGNYTYQMRLKLRPTDDACEVAEESTLPVRLWPAPRPYREIGTLSKSHWDQKTADIAKPCTRPRATSNFVLAVDGDRMVTHSTGSWEIMNLPLGSPTVKTYTAMRPALPFIDGAWLGVYESRRPELLGVAALDICHWKAPDDMIHPAHRTPGANAEVLLVDLKAGPHFRFPIENVTRRWLLTVVPRPPVKTNRGEPLRCDPDPEFPLWALHTRRGDLRLDKVKDWVVDWPDRNDAHPRVLCRPADFADIRRKINTIPAFRKNHARFRRWRGADRHILTGERVSLQEIEAQTNARKLVEEVLRQGYSGRHYAIGFARPLRRYAIACDIVWDTFTPEEKREARRVCALAGYFLSDGDFWQYALRPGETTYLPNFNSDVFTCFGIVGLFLHDHPCGSVWAQGCVERLDLDFKYYLRTDGGGEENVGSYLTATWAKLYLPALWALRHCGVKDYSADSNVLAGARFLLKVICPPDPRDQNLRLLPSIGHHPQARKAFLLFSQLASFIKKADPLAASHLMAAWQAMGSPVSEAPDHFGVNANPLTRHYIFHDPSIPAVAQEYGSYDLPNVGAVLRSHGGSDRESYLFLKAGRVHSHHDEDEGSFHYFGRGVPLALDALRVQNGAEADEHNAVTFGKPGQPSGLVECFRSTEVADYVRAVVAPRGYCCDANYVDDTHRSGWTREIVFVKSAKPGGVEYVIIKDSVVGPDPCQWNLDVLSREPKLHGNGHIWFPGHKAFNMGLDVLVLEPTTPAIKLSRGIVNPDLLSAASRCKLADYLCNPTVTEHWLLHMPAAPGTTFVTGLFPRREREMSPVIEYATREETIRVRHAEGSDLIFLRPNPVVGTSLAGIVFQGRAGICYERGAQRVVQPLDAKQMKRGT